MNFLAVLFNRKVRKETLRVIKKRGVRYFEYSRPATLNPKTLLPTSNKLIITTPSKRKLYLEFSLIKVR